MKPLTLHMLIDGEMVAEWTLPAENVELSLRDPQTGQELAVLRPQGLVNRHAECELEPIGEQSEPELTLPLEDEGLTPESSELSVEAELWTRSPRGWQKRGSLKMGQKATYGEALVRLKRSGELVVTPGPWLSGGAELPAGGDLHIPAGKQSHRFPPGTSIILTSPRGRGFFVKSQLGDVEHRPVVERTREAQVTQSSYQPPLSDLGLFNEDERG